MKKILFLLYITALYSSCGLTDNFSEEPMYLQINSASLTGTPQVGNSHDIKDAWVYVDGFNVGIFELPATVPILSSGNTVNVDIRAGVRDNGIQLSARQYPFYKTLNYTFDFIANETIELDLTYEYVDNVQFTINENFELGNVFFDDVDGNPLSTISRSNETPYGSFCGKSEVSADLSRFEQATSEVYLTNVFQSSEVYLEIDYKCDVSFIVGYIGYRNSVKSTIGVITLFEEEEWSKLYLDMSADLNSGVFDEYQLVIAGAGTNQDGNIWIDNVRIVHL